MSIYSRGRRQPKYQPQGLAVGSGGDVVASQQFGLVGQPGSTQGKHQRRRRAQPQRRQDPNAWLQDPDQVNEVAVELDAAAIRGSAAPGKGIVPIAQINQDFANIIASGGPVVGWDMKKLSPKARTMLGQLMGSRKQQLEKGRAQRQQADQGINGGLASAGAGLAKGLGI